MVTRSTTLIYSSHGFSRLLWLLLVLGGGLLCIVGGVKGECPHLQSIYGCTCTKTTVNCEKKKIETLPHAKYFPSGVQYLYFATNSLSQIDLTHDRFSNLKIIDFSSNKLESNSGISKSVRALKHLEELYLKDNKLTDIDTSYLDDTEVKILDLSNNPLERFRIDDDDDISVEDFRLTNSHFADFPFKALKVFTKLETLDISGNDISHFDDVTFFHSTELKELHLNNNNFTTLSESEFNKLKNLKKIWLADNPWNCDCSLQWLHDRMNERGHSIFQDRDQVRCTKHPDTALMDVPRKKFSSSGCHKLVKREAPEDPEYDPKLTATDKTDISGSLGSATCVQEASQSRFVIYNIKPDADTWTKCHQSCFNKNYTYYVMTTDNECFCGNVNVNCTCACAESYTTIPGAKGIMSGIKVNYTSPVVIATPVTLALQWDVTYDSMEVDFGDGSHVVTTSLTSVAHTFLYPGNFQLKIRLCRSESGSCGEVETSMKVSSLDDDGKLWCDECVKLSEAASVNARFTYGYNSEIVWSRTAQEDSATVSTPCLFGEKYSGNDHCYILYDDVKDWASAKSNCTDTHGGSLATVEDEQLSLFLVQIMNNQSVKEAWIGLNKSATLDNYIWTTGNLFRGATDGLKMECGYISDDDIIDTFGCSDKRSFICEYTPNDVVNSEMHVAGSLELEDVGEATTELASSNDAVVSSYSLMYMPGHWFTVSGRILSFTFRAVSLSADTLIKLVIYRPNCTTDIENKPGCGGNQFFSCDNKTNGCVPRPAGCSSGNTCYLFNECITPSQACSCSGAHSGSIMCGSNPIVTGRTPLYTSVGHTTAQIPKDSPHLYKVKSNIRVQLGDFIGVLYQGADRPIKCITDNKSQWSHLLYTVPTVTGENSDIPTATDPEEHQLCLINAVYSRTKTVPLPSQLASLPEVGLYTFKYKVQSSGSTQTCNVTAVEEVGQIVWVYPHPDSSGKIQVELNDIATLVAKVTSGSHLKYEWTIGGVNVTSNMTLSENCPLSVANSSVKCPANDTSLVKPFTFIQHTFTASMDLRLKVSNKVSSVEKTYHVVLGPCMPIQGLQLCHESCQTPSGCADPCEPIIQPGVSTFFPVMYTQGSADSTYTFRVNDTEEVGTSDSNRSLSFPSTGFHRVTVNMTCGTHSDTAGLGVHVKQPADVTDLKVLVPAGVVIGEKFILTVTSHVKENADIEIIVDFGDGKDTKHVNLVTSGSELNKPIEYTYATEKHYTVRVVIQDVFKNVSVSASLYALAAVSATARAEPQYAKPGQDIQFKLRAVPVSGHDVKLDSKMYYNWSFPDRVHRIESEVVSSSYKHKINHPGTYNISVSASNLASSFYTYAMVYIQECITGLKFQYDGPVHINNTVNFTASIEDGTDVRYSMDPDKGSGTINQTNSTFLINFSRPGIYNTSVIAYNDLTSCALSRDEITAYVIDDETLFLLDILPKKCLPSKKPDVLAAVAININPSGLNYTWRFGNGTEVSGIGLLNVTIFNEEHGSYEVSISSKGERFVKNVCIQEEITNLTIAGQGIIGVTPGETTMDNITTSVSTGSNISYVWTVNKDETAECNLRSCVVKLATNGSYHIGVNASNNVSSDTAHIVLEAQFRVINLTLTCSSCEKVKYQSTSKDVTMSAIAAKATAVSYRYSYGGDWMTDTSHRFHNVSTYNVCVNASNLVSDKTECMDIVTQDEIETLTLTWNVSAGESDFEVEVGTHVQFTANYTKGTNVTFTWSCGDDIVTDEGPVFVCHFQQSKKHSFSVTAVNEVSSQKKTMNIYVLQEITSLNISQNLFQGRYAATGEDISFTAQSNTDLNVAYHWMVKSSTDTCEVTGESMEGHCNDKHFSEVGLYNISLYANNSLNYLATSTEIEVMKRIKGLQIKFDSNAVSVNTNTVFTAEVTEGENLVYHWTVKIGSTAELKDSSTATMTHLFDKEGRYEVSVNATSKLEPEGRNSGNIIYVEEMVSDIQIQTATQYVALGSEAVFDTTRKSGSSLSLTWKLSGPGTTVVNNEVSLSHRFVHIGEYALSVNASNRLNSDTDTMVIYVEEKVLSVSITVNKSIIKTATAIWFNAGPSPAGSYTYNWTINEEQCHIDADTFDKFFNSSGIYVVKVYVYNNVSFAVDSTEIIVQEPISGLRFDTCESKVTGEETTITALMSHGTDVTYSWDYSSPDGSKSTAKGKDLTLDFEHEGYYHIKLLSENNVSSKQLNCTVKSQGKVNITDLVVKSDSKYNFVNQTIFFEVKGSNLHDVNITWVFNDSYVNKTVDKKLQRMFASAGPYVLTVTVNNDVSQDEKTQQFYIHVLDCQLPKVTVISTLPDKILRSQPLDLAVSINSSNCTEYQSKHVWQVFRASSCSEPGGKIELGSTNSPTLHLQARTLPVGSYCVVFNTSYQDTFVYETVNVNFTVVASELFAVIAGGSDRVVSQDAALNISCLDSMDPDMDATALSCSWSCISTTSEPCPWNSREDSNFLTSFPSGEYTLELTVTDATSGRTASTSQTITVVPEAVPSLTVKCLSCSETGSINANQQMVFSSQCSNCKTDTNFTWTLEVDGKLHPLDESVILTSPRGPNLVIKQGVIPVGSTYKVTVSTAFALISRAGSSSLKLHGNQAPSGGSCTVSPTTLQTLQSEVKVSCSGWSDSDNTAQLFYKVIASGTSSTGTTETFQVYYGINREPTFYLASFPGSNKVTLEVQVMDNAGAYMSTSAGVLTVETPANMTDYIFKQAQSTLPALIKKNTPSLLLPYVIALSQELNHESDVRPSLLSKEKRATIRDAITMTLMAIPVTGLEDVQQVAYLLQLLTKYFDEYQTESCHLVIVESLKNITNVLQANAFQGRNQEDFVPHHLLATISNLIEAVNLGVYNPDAVSGWETYPVQDFYRNFVDLRPEISSTLEQVMSSHSPTFRATDVKHRRAVIPSAFEIAEQIMTTILMTTMWQQQSMKLNLGGIEVHGQRSKVKEIWSTLELEGCEFHLPANLFDGIIGEEEEIFQIMFVLSKNPFTWGYINNMTVNSRVPSLSFRFNNGKPIPLKGLPKSKHINMIMFENIVQSNNTQSAENSSLSDSIYYKPLANLDYTKDTIKRSKAKRVNFDVSTGADGASGFHIQVRMEVVANATEEEEGVLPRGSMKVYLGDNFLPTQSTYTDYKLISTSDMADKVDHRKYTFFITSERKSQYTLSMYNDDTYHDINISIAIYLSSCQFFNTERMDWDNNGCQAMDESITTRTACRCNHLTSFGSSMLVPPGAINIVDLVNLDLSTNPVVMIAIGIILFVYIVVVFICRKLDRMDLQRVTRIPLCGKMGHYKYEITVVTGRKMGAGTTAHIGMKLYGEDGKGEMRHLTKVAAFQRNCTDKFLIAYDTRLGDLKKILIWHDNTGLSPSWYLSHVVVRDLSDGTLGHGRTYYFVANAWLSVEMPPGLLKKEIPAANELAIQTFSNTFKMAASHGFADKHLWMSLMDRHDHSRFTRVQRATCCVTVILFFMMVNAIWYGIIKTSSDAKADYSFSWEEVVIGLVSNVVVLPVAILLVFLFKSSRSKKISLMDIEDTEIEIPDEEEMDFNDFDSYYCGESTTGQIPATSLKRTQTEFNMHVALSEEGSILSGHEPSKPPSTGKSNMSISRMWDPLNILNWADEKNPSWKEDRASTAGTTRGEVKKTATSASTFTSRGKPKSAKSMAPDSDEEWDKKLDQLHQDLTQEEEEKKKKRAKMATAKKGNGKTSNKGADELFCSDEEWATEGLEDAKGGKSGGKKTFTKTPARAAGATAQPRFNPREDPKLRRARKTSFNLDDVSTDDEGVKEAKASKQNIQVKGQPPTSGKQTSTKDDTKKDFPERKASTTSSILKKRDSYGRAYSAGSSLKEISFMKQPSIMSEKSKSNMSAIWKRNYYSSTNYTTESEATCMLPSWCVYMAYGLCLLISAVSIIIVLLYGYQFGSEVSLKWLLSLFLAFCCSALVIEPTKVLLVALYLAARSRDVQEEIEKESITIPPVVDNVFETFKDVKFRPLGGFALMHAKEEGVKIQRMHVILRQFISHMFLMSLLLAICFIYNGTINCMMSQHVQHLLQQDGAAGLNLSQVRSIPDFRTWTETVLADTLHHRELNPQEQFGILLGPARLRQIRSTLDDCPISSPLAKFNLPALTALPCKGNLGFSEDTATYGEAWNNSIGSNATWRHFTAPELHMREKYGHDLHYSGGGYVMTLGTTYNETLSILNDLFDKDWINLRTRAVFIEFSLYSAAIDLTTTVTVLLEFPLTGGALSSQYVSTIKLLRFIPGRVDPLMVTEVLFLLCTIYLFVHLGLTIHEERAQFVKQFWNWLDLVIAMLTVVCIGLYIACVVTATDTFGYYTAHKNDFTNFEMPAHLHDVMRTLHAWLLFLIFLKVVRQLRFFPMFHAYGKTISNAMGKLAGCTLIFLLLLMSYAQLGYLYFGMTTRGFASFQSALLSLMGVIRGSFNFLHYLHHWPVMTHFYFYSFYAFAYGLFIGLVIAVMLDTYKITHQSMFFKSSLDTQDHEMIEFMMKRFKLWAGITKQKPAFRSVRFKGHPSLPSRASSTSRRSSISSSLSSGSDPVLSEEQALYLEHQLDNAVPRWEHLLNRFDRIEKLEVEEDHQIKKIEKELKGWETKQNSPQRKPPVKPKSTFEKFQHNFKGKSQFAGKDKHLVGRTSITPPTISPRKPVTETREVRPHSYEGERSEAVAMKNLQEKKRDTTKNVRFSKPAW